MSKKITILLAFFLLGNLFLKAQKINDNKFSFKLIGEDFIKKQDNFPIVRDNENYFIIDENEYLIIRENSNSDYAIILDESLAKNTFHRTAVKLGPSDNPKSSFGIILKANKEFSKALIFEINNEGKFRIKELKNNSYNYLSKKKNKWLKNKAINKVNKYNTIEIKSVNNLIRIIVNKTEITTLEYKNNQDTYSGILVGPDTKARIKYFYLNTDKSNAKRNNTTDIVKEVNNTEIESYLNKDEFTSTINTLESKIKSQEQIIKNLKNDILLSDKTSDIEKFKIDLKDSNEKLESQKLEIDKLINQNKELISTQNQEKTINEEKLINLNEKLNGLAFENKNLQKEIEIKADQITKLKNNLSQLKNEKNSLNNLKDKNEDLLDNKSKEITSLKEKLKSEKDASILTQKENQKKYIQLERQNLNLNKNNNILSKKLNTLESDNLRLIEDKKTIAKENLELNNQSNQLITENKTKNEKIIQLSKELKKQKENNIFLKDLFVYKDFELNGVIPKQEIKEEIKEKVELSNDSIFTLQLGVFHYPTSEFKDLKNAYNIIESNLYKYFYGKYDNLNDVNIDLENLKKLGYNNAFIVKKLN